MRVSRTPGEVPGKLAVEGLDDISSGLNTEMEAIRVFKDDPELPFSFVFSLFPFGTFISRFRVVN